MSHDTTASGSAGGSPANAQRLLWAGFMAILAAGVGFSIRAGILGQWAEQYGFTQTELGAITGGGLTGFGIIILLSSLIADRIGFGPLMFLAFGMHLISAALTLATGAAYEAGGKPLAFQCLFWGMFLFAIGNGIAEAVVNPLVATLFPQRKTHYPDVATIKLSHGRKIRMLNGISASLVQWIACGHVGRNFHICIVTNLNCGSVQQCVGLLCCQLKQRDGTVNKMIVAPQPGQDFCGVR